MLKKYLVVIFSFYCPAFSVSVTSQTFPLIDNLKKELHPHQITVLDEKATSGNPRKGKFIEELSAYLPTVNVDLASHQANRSLMLKVHENPRAARVTYLILQDKLDIDQAKRTIDLIVQLAPVPTRPKCILIHFDDQPSEHHYGKIFEHAWANKFLDFAIFQLEGNDYVSYNPFVDKTSHAQLNPSGKLFPDKLRNINKYPLLLPFCDNPPFLHATFNNVTGEKKISGTMHKPVELFISYVNGSAKYVKMEASVYFKLDLFFGNLSDGKISVGLVAMVSSYAYGRSAVLSKLHLTSDIVFVVPILSHSILNFPSNLIACLICALAIILSFKLAARALKLSFKDWNTFEVIQLFLGISLTKPVDKLPERILGLSIVLLSMKISSDLIAALADVKILKEELSLNSFEDFRHNGIPVYTMPSIKDLVFGNEPKWIKDQIIPKVDMTDCFAANERGEPSVCIGGTFSIISFLEQHKNARMKVLQPRTSTDFLGYPFERASPYVEKFNDFMTRLIEAGLFDRFYPKHKKQELDIHELLINESSIAVVLLIVLAIGFSIALIAFVAEIYMPPRKSLMFYVIREIFS